MVLPIDTGILVIQSTQSSSKSPSGGGVPYNRFATVNRHHFWVLGFFLAAILGQAIFRDFFVWPVNTKCTNSKGLSCLSCWILLFSTRTLRLFKSDSSDQNMLVLAALGQFQIPAQSLFLSPRGPHSTGSKFQPTGDSSSSLPEVPT